jgi:hypothetical protein
MQPMIRAVGETLAQQHIRLSDMAFLSETVTSKHWGMSYLLHLYVVRV